MVAAAIAGGAALTAGASYLGSKSASSSANKASEAQSEASAAQIAESERQFDTVRNLLQPFVTGGTNAFSAQQNMLGLNGAGNEASAINDITNSPTFQSILNRGETSILQNASATGGLRGGNVQQALAQYSPSLLNAFIQQRFQNLGQLTGIGQNAAAGTGNAAIATGGQINSAYGDMGAARAGNAIAQGNAQQSLFSNLANIGGTSGLLYSIYGKGGGGGGAASMQNTSDFQANPFGNQF